MQRTILTLSAGVLLFVGVLMSPLAFMGIGYGTPKGYIVALVTCGLIAVGIIGVVRFYRRSN